MKFRAKNSLWFAYLLNILTPGLGHAYYRELLFGLFIFLIMLTASALFFLSFFIPLPVLAKLALFGLPTVFFLFSFADLHRSVRSRREEHPPTSRRAMLFLAIGFIYLVAVPSSPGNFLLRNAPVFFTTDSSLTPLQPSGHLAAANRLAYTADIFFVDQRIVHELPERFDIIRFTSEGRNLTGIILAFPGEEIEITDGSLSNDGTPELSRHPLTAALAGDWPLTASPGRSMLVATMTHGRVSNVYTVPLTDIIGKTVLLL